MNTKIERSWGWCFHCINNNPVEHKLNCILVCEENKEIKRKFSIHIISINSEITTIDNEVVSLFEHTTFIKVKLHTNGLVGHYLYFLLSWIWKKKLIIKILSKKNLLCNPNSLSPMLALLVGHMFIHNIRREILYQREKMILFIFLINVTVKTFSLPYAKSLHFKWSTTQ